MKLYSHLLPLLISLLIKSLLHFLFYFFHYFAKDAWQARKVIAYIRLFYLLMYHHQVTEIILCLLMQVIQIF